MKPIYAWVVSALSVGLAAGVGHEHFLGDHGAASACPAAMQGMARTELLFGMSRPDGAIVTDADWNAFLDAEVTPRFPDGLTILDGHGQWRSASGAIAKEDATMLLIWYEPDAAREGAIEDIRTAYKTRFDQESVMRIDERSCVSF